MSDIGLLAQVACVWEATARKPGNVYRYRDFHDATYLDFLLSAAALAPVLAEADRRRVGDTVLECVRVTRRVAGSNTNLGIVLLLAPLASVPPGEALRAGVERVLNALDVEDARLVYQAIRLATPGGLGEVPEQDVCAEPTKTLREVMALAADRDLVARQYANGFREVFDDGVPALEAGLGHAGSLEGGIILAHLHLMAHYPDTLIARKCGPDEAAEAGRRARQVLDMDWPHGRGSVEALADLDAWLRAEGNRRNPGTTADLVAACLFVGLRTERITLPPPFPWPALPPQP
jgi:triphosphoribosyl-dephospho-CoA synthase